MSDLDQRVIDLVPPGGNWRNLPLDFPSKRIEQIRVGASNGGGSRSTYYGRLRGDRPAYTINTYITRPGNGCFIHPSAPRLISLREAARLQTIPDYITFEGPLRARCTQLGNAVPPLLAYHLGTILPKGDFVDLFAGAGGLGLGLTLAGHTPVLSTDIDASACKTLEGHAGPTHEVVQADLSKASDFDDLIQRTADRSTTLDLVVGGPPCQGFSTAGPCRVNDPRNRLVRAFIRFVEETRPRRVVMENVPALRWRGGLFLAEFCERLEHLGYITDTVLLHAEAYGVPQLRRRLVVQATLDGDIVWPDPVAPIREPSFRGDQPGVDGQGTVSSVADAISDLPATTTTHLDEVVPYASTATTPLQSWLRGECNIDAVSSEAPCVARCVPDRANLPVRDQLPRRFPRLTG